jgi:hypothetical protein
MVSPWSLLLFVYIGASTAKKKNRDGKMASDHTLGSYKQTEYKSSAV